MKVTVTPPGWPYESLWAKSVLYYSRAFDTSRDTDLFAFWCALGLEILARASLAYVNPALLASTNDSQGATLMRVLGLQTKDMAAKLKSIDISEVFRRCEILIPNFLSEERSFCTTFLEMRNEELHTGGLPFEMAEKKWLPPFLRASICLLGFQERALINLIGYSEAKDAQNMLDALAVNNEKEIKKLIHTHRELWRSKIDEEKTRLRLVAQTHSTPDRGHVVSCPACSSSALVSGQKMSEQEPSLVDGMLVFRENILPTVFECAACGLRMEGYSRLAAAGFANTYTRKLYSDPLDWFGTANDETLEYNNE
jgi:hypothetical protein